jgi:type I restriction enzyme S subunit
MKTTKLDFPVMSSWMENNGRRLDCNPYLSGAFEAKVILEKLSAKKQPLHEVTQGGMKGIFNGPRFARNYVEDPEYGIPFLGSVDILAADLSNLTLLSKKQVASHPELLIDEGWTLITCSGTIGRMVYSRSEMMGMAGSQHFMRVIANPDKILPGYLYAYLSSSFGVPIVISGTYGSIIQSIEPQHIADLPVPRLGKDIEEKAHKNIEESAKLRSEYQIQIKEATHRLFSAVGLKDITAVDWHKMGKDLGFSHNLESHISLRAANFNPRFKKLCETISSTQYKEIDEICMPGTLQRAGRYKRIDADPEFGCQLIGQRQLFWLRPEGRWVAKSALGDDVFVKPGTILVAARGTLGESELYCRSEFIWGAAISMAYSEDMLRIIADEQIMPRGCLFAFLRSETAFRMLRSSTMGSKMQDHHHEFVSHLPVPYPDKEIQQEIHEIVVNAYEKRHLSNVLEDEAVAIVEQAISSGGV